MAARWPEAHGSAAGSVTVTAEDGQLRVFWYREGEHFHIPRQVEERFGQLRRIPLLEGTDEDGNCLEGGFRAVDSPEAADFVLFPYVLDQFIMDQRAMAVHFFIRRLPHFVEHERKHVFFHCHDRGHPLFTEALIITDDPDRSNVDDPYIRTLPHYPGARLSRFAPDFDFGKIELDTNFIGALSWPVRMELINGIMNEPGLRYQIRHPNTLDWSCSQTSYLHMDDQVKKRQMELLFISAMRRSWTTLCPRGMGSSSIRFYETMCMGRLPVHVSDAYRLPFENEIDYAEFSLFIPESEARHAGKLIRAWLARQGKDRLMAMCRKARETWERYFQPHDEKNVCLRHLREHLPQTGAKPRDKYRLLPSELLADEMPRCHTPVGFYANMVVDDRRLWLNRQLEVRPQHDMPGTNLVNGLRTDITMERLLSVLDLAKFVPENGSAVCVGATNGVVEITLATGLLSARNYSSIIYGAADWLDGEGVEPWQTKAQWEDNIAGAGVGTFVRAVPGGTKAASRAFRDECLDLVVLVGSIDSPDRSRDLALWLPKLRPGARLAVLNCPEHALRPLGDLADDYGLLTQALGETGGVVLEKPRRTPSSGRNESPEQAEGNNGAAPHAGLRPRFLEKFMEESDRYLVVRATGGMGNRLLGIICAVAYSLVSKRRLFVNWSDFMYSDRGENVFPRLFRLLDVPATLKAPPGLDVVPEFWRQPIPAEALIEQFGIDHHDPAVMAATRIDLNALYDNAVATFWSYDLKPMQSALDHLREAVPQFRGLDLDGMCSEIMKQHVQPRPLVAGRVDDFAAKNFPGPMVGVHIRYTDLRSPLEPIMEAVEGLRSDLDAGVFLATDSREIEGLMREKYGDALVFMPKKYPQNNGHMHSHRVEGLSNFEKAVDAAVEMYLLARCDAIVRYRPSSFAQISGYCSGLPAERLVCVE